MSAMSAFGATVLRDRADAPVYTFAAMGIEVRVLVSTHESGGTQSVTEFAFTGPFPGPPLHWHRSYSETFVCLEGTFTLLINGGERRLMPGDIAYIPPGELHTYMVDGSVPTRYLLVCAPGGQFEQYVADAAQLAAEAYTQNRTMDMETLRALRGRYETYEADVPRF
jgi:quercetin dioxygenase-like cupin family protein